MYENTALAITLAGEEKSPLDITIQDLALRKIVPLTVQENATSAWLHDGLIRFLILENNQDKFVGSNGSFYCDYASIQFWLLALEHGLDVDAVATKTSSNFISAVTQRSLVDPPDPWPASEMPAGTSQILMPWNPLGNHWYYLKVVMDMQTTPPSGRIELHDSLGPVGKSGSMKKRTVIRDAERIFPGLANLITSRPYLGAVSRVLWSNTVTEEPCTRQANLIDCGPLYLNNIIRDLQGLDLLALGTPEGSNKYGLELRYRYLGQV